MNIIDAILFHGKYDPEAPAICFPGLDLVSYARLEKSINNIARHGQNIGLMAGHMIALHMPGNPSLQALMILGLMKLGVITATVSSLRMPQSFKFDAIITDEGQSFPGLQSIPATAQWLEGNGEAPVLRYVPQGNDVCRIILTSGTTGEPKGVALTHNMILGRLMRYYHIFGAQLPTAQRIFCDMTLATSIGFTFFIYALIKGGTYFARGLNAEVTMRALRLHRVEALVAAPAGLAEIINAYDTYQCRHLFGSIISTGSALSRPLLDSIRAHMGSFIVTGYGSTEAGQIATMSAHQIDRAYGAAGYITPGTQVEIVDESGNPQTPGTEGIVRIRGDYMATRYLGETPQSGSHFRDGWFYPGDLGRLQDDGLLILEGRSENVMNLGGEKIKPEFIEGILASVGITAGIYMTPNALGINELHALVETSEGFDETTMRQACLKQLPERMIPKRFIDVARLPRNDMGKIDRKALENLVVGKISAA